MFLIDVLHNLGNPLLTGLFVGIETTTDTLYSIAYRPLEDTTSRDCLANEAFYKRHLLCRRLLIAHLVFYSLMYISFFCFILSLYMEGDDSYLFFLLLLPVFFFFKRDSLNNLKKH